MSSKWQVTSLQSARKMEKGAGLYCIYDEGVIVYIGQSRDIRKRLYQYAIKPPLVKYNNGDGWQFGFGVIKAEPGRTIWAKYRYERKLGEGLMAELRLIARLQPKYNIVGKGAGHGKTQ